MPEMTPGMDNDSPSICIGHGAPDSGCGHKQPTWGNGVCVQCGGMLFTARMRAESDALLSWLDDQAGPRNKPEPPTFESV